MGKTVQVKVRIANVKLTPDQYAMLTQRAARCGLRLSVWMRSILLQAASRPASKRKRIIILEPDGATL